MSKKLKGLLAVGDINPRTKSNLLETFVSNRYSFFFQVKLQKKPSEDGWLFFHSMSLKQALLWYNTFTFLHQTLSKRNLKKENYPEIRPKTNKKSSPGNFETRKHA